MEYHKVVSWKNRLLKKLNDGIMDVSDWERFISVAYESKCTSMSEDMRKRLEHYAGVEL